MISNATKQKKNKIERYNEEYEILKYYYFYYYYYYFVQFTKNLIYINHKK